jgi:hypothetical protein
VAQDRAGGGAGRPGGGWGGGAGAAGPRPAPPLPPRAAAGWIEQNWSEWVSAGLRILLIAVIAILLRHVIRRAISRLIKRVNRRAEAADSANALRGLLVSGERRRQRSQAIGSVLRSIASFVIIGTALLMVLSDLGINLAPLRASAGVAGVALGFGARDVVTDLLAGIFMLLEDQYGVGDRIDAGEVTGTVLEIGLRVTTLRADDGEVGTCDSISTPHRFDLTGHVGPGTVAPMDLVGTPRPVPLREEHMGGARNSAAQTGSQAFERARTSAKLAESKSLAAADAAIDAQAALARPASPASVQRAGGRLFVQRGEVWTDLGHSDRITITAIAAYSKAYFELVRLLPEVVPYLSIGDEIVIAGREGSVRIGTAGIREWRPGQLADVVRTFRGT